MIRVAELPASARDRWDAHVLATGSGFMQSWAWSEFKEVEGYTVTRLGAFAGDRLVGGAIVYAFPSPAEVGLAAIPDGPAIVWDSPQAPEVFAALLDAYRASEAGERIIAVRVEPRLEAVPAALLGLPRAPVDLVPDETLEIALDGEDRMLAAMKPKGRYNIRLAARHGVEVTTSVDPADVHEFYRLLDHTGQFHDFLVEPKSFFINLARTLMPAHARLAVARWKGMTLAAALTVRHGDTVTYLYGGHLPLFTRVMASSALHWHVMAAAARDGLRVYDLYGWVPPGRPGHPYDAFSRFKDKLGGRPRRRIGSRDVIFYDRLADVAIDAVSALVPEAPWPAA
jgi:lipid II:glycine glycyltransferase (peptidoglycan interpeptide bridge formation enzyme)